ncbi:MAG: TolB family protein [Terriglobales bacterium]
MRNAVLAIVVLASVCLLGLQQAKSPAGSQSSSAPVEKGPAMPQEKHLSNLRQLTFGGQNAEAYFSADGRQLIFQSTRGGLKCDQIFAMNLDGSNVRQLSSGKGRTTCAYFFPDGKKILYSSTELRGGPECPPPPDYSKGYRWAVYPTYDILVANADGSNPRPLTHEGYNAEAAISPDGKKIVFTSTRDGDLDIYTMQSHGTQVNRLTTELGYDGGAFWSRDGQWIVYRAYHPKAPEEITEYKELLKQNLIKPMNLELWVMRADGSDKRQITHNGAANFGPYFFPDGKRIIFSSNLLSHDVNEMGNFEIFAINVDGSGLERITYNPTFDGFPMFSPDGKKLVFASNRNAKVPHETNVFIADWKP